MIGIEKYKQVIHLIINGLNGFLRDYMKQDMLKM